MTTPLERVEAPGAWRGRRVNGVNGGGETAKPGAPHSHTLTSCVTVQVHAGSINGTSRTYADISCRGSEGQQIISVDKYNVLISQSGRNVCLYT
jgi:hypothetical protein